MLCHRVFIAAATLVVALGLPAQAAETDKDDIYPMAILPFEDRGDVAKGVGQQVSDLLLAELASRREIYLVERGDLEAILREQGLNLSGVVRPAEAIQVGQLTGAKILLAGSVIRTESNIYLVAKIIGTETSRVLGASVKGKTGDDLAAMVAELGEQVAVTIRRQAGDLVAEPASREQVVDRLRRQLRGPIRPSVVVKVAERHIGQPTIDPAVETELMLLAGELGFPIIDSQGPKSSDADVMISGEAFSEFAARHGNLVSVRCRVEVKAVRRSTGQVLAVDRQTTVRVDLSEQTAAKSALQQAAAEIAQRLLPKIAKSNES